MAVYRDKRRPTRPWVIDISYIDRRTGKRTRYFRDAKLQTAEGARTGERNAPGQARGEGFIPQPEDLAESVKENKELTLKEARELYEKTVRPTLKPSTAIGYSKNLRAYLLPRFGDWSLSDIDRAALIAFDQELARESLSSATRNNIVMRLAGHCHLSVTERYAHTNDVLMREAVQVFARRAGYVNGT